MNAEWDWKVSRSALRVLDVLPRRERMRLMALFDEIAASPLAKADDEPMRDNHGRLQHLRFADGYVLMLWFDHADRVVNILSIGRH